MFTERAAAYAKACRKEAKNRGVSFENADFMHIRIPNVSGRYTGISDGVGLGVGAGVPVFAVEGTELHGARDLVFPDDIDAVHIRDRFGEL